MLNQFIKAVLISVAISLLSGCASKNPWKRDNTSFSDADADLRACEKEVGALTDGDIYTPLKDIPFAYVFVAAVDMAVESYRERNCMEAKGYRTNGEAVASDSTKGSALASDNETTSTPPTRAMQIGDWVYPKFASVFIYYEKFASNTVVETVSAGDSRFSGMKILEVDNGWVRVATAGGKIGWAKTSSVKKN